MRHPNPLSVPRRFARSTQRHRTVCVVDAKHDDYRQWCEAVTELGLQLKFVATAEKALKIARGERVDLWVVNTALPGLSGAELCSMLRMQGHAKAVYLVADEYSPATEVAAWRARATMFVCKPAHHKALAGCLERARKISPDGSKAVAQCI